MAGPTNTAVLAHAEVQSIEAASGPDDAGSAEVLVNAGVGQTEPVAPSLDQTSDTDVVIGTDSDPTPTLRSPATRPDARAETGVKTRELPDPTTLGFRSWSSRYVYTVAACDSLVGLAAMLVAGTVAKAAPLAVSTPSGWMLLAGLAWPLAIAAVRGYERSRVGIGGDEMRALLRAVVLVVAVSAVPAGLVMWHSLLTAAVTTAPTAAAFSLVVRFVSRKWLHSRQRHGIDVRKVVVVGSVAAAADLCDILRQEKHCGMQVVGVCVPGADVVLASGSGLSVIGDLEQVPDVIREFDCDAVAVTSGDATRHNFLRELSWSLEGTDVELLVHPGLIEVAGPRMHIRPFVGLPLLYVEQPHFTGWRRLVKRATDISLAGLGVVAVAPILAVIAAAIKLQDGGPVIFRQTRVGIEGRAFTMLKFRSMVIDAEERKGALIAHNEATGPLFKIRHDPRITRLGRFLRDFSLDELPQLINVLGGSMSLVGPRPQLKSEVDELQPDARRRLLVTPGVTGLWQVSGRSDLAWEESVRLDLRYVENWSLTMDLHILWKTLHAVITKHGSR
jgi:exopolysaccharide biosynthesis polyprenyl glycosylphosphotransferase